MAGIQAKLRPLGAHYICHMAYIQRHCDQGSLLART